MIYDRRFWFAPAYSINKAVDWRSIKEHLTGDERKVFREVLAGGLYLLGISKLTGDFYRMQLVHPEDRTPDLRTARAITGPNGRPIIEYQDLEVVTQELHSNEQLDDFIKRTKLSPLKAYQDETIILCHGDESTNHLSLIQTRMFTFTYWLVLTRQRDKSTELAWFTRS